MLRCSWGRPQRRDLKAIKKLWASLVQEKLATAGESADVKVLLAGRCSYGSPATVLAVCWKDLLIAGCITVRKYL